MKAIDVEKVLKAKENKDKAKLLARFFKTGKGEYGEGDTFWGITVPEQRVVAKEFVALSLPEIKKLLQSPVHECRLTALLILTYQYAKAVRNSDPKTQKNIFDVYIKNTKYINNWDLVDVTCHIIVGGYLYDKDRSILYDFANSKNIWKKRIAIVSTFYFIREKDFSDSLKIGEMLLGDTHDLIHKAVGWMLREVGKRDEKVLHDFLKKNVTKMPRTTLRYSIERLPEEFRRYYMNM